ncbi:MAG: hypothetical protein HEQ38_01655 [Gemmatimonas sp.]|nr:hypothetical protein [Gemmatimonas sp.]
MPDLLATIEHYILQSNQNPSVFDWTASVENILAKTAKWKEALGARH